MEKKVKIYATSSCGYCQQAKKFLTEKGIEFEAVDVVADKEAFKEMKEISGGVRSVPVISVGGKILVGYDRDELEKALKALE